MSARRSIGTSASLTGWRKIWPCSTARSQDAIDDSAVNRLMTITGVNLAVAAGIMGAIGDISRFNRPQKLVSYFKLNPRVRQSGPGAAHHGRISKIGRSHARAMLVEAAWSAAKAPGPLHAFFVRIRARRGDQIAAVAVARKLTVLCWHLLTKGEDYLWARPALVAIKTCAMQLQAGHPQQKGSRRGPAYAYNIKALRDREMLIAAQAEQSYERLVTLETTAAKNRRAGASARQDKIGNLVALAADAATLRHEVARARQG